jgi:hypothetical protein
VKPGGNHPLLIISLLTKPPALRTTTGPDPSSSRPFLLLALFINVVEEEFYDFLAS